MLLMFHVDTKPKSQILFIALLFVLVIGLIGFTQSVLSAPSMPTNIQCKSLFTDLNASSLNQKQASSIVQKVQSLISQWPLIPVYAVEEKVKPIFKSEKFHDFLTFFLPPFTKSINEMRGDLKHWKKRNELFKFNMLGAMAAYVMADSPLSNKEEVLRTILELHSLTKDQIDSFINKPSANYSEDFFLRIPPLRQILRAFGCKNPLLAEVPQHFIDALVQDYIAIKQSEPSSGDTTRSRLAILWSYLKYGVHNWEYGINPPWYLELMYQFEKQVVKSLNIEFKTELRYALENIVFAKTIDAKLPSFSNQGYHMEEFDKERFWIAVNKIYYDKKNLSAPDHTSWKEIFCSFTGKDHEFSDFKLIPEIVAFLNRFEIIDNHMKFLIGTPLPTVQAKSAVPLPTNLTTIKSHHDDGDKIPSTLITKSDFQQTMNNMTKDLSQVASSVLFDSHIEPHLEKDQKNITSITSEDRDRLVRFHKFFDSLKSQFLERNQVIEAVKLIFLMQESLLLLSSPGTAKTQMIDAIGKSLIEQSSGNPSYFSLQLTPETTPSEIFGGVVVKQAMQGKIMRKYDEGILGSTVVFLDEFFDGRMKFLRSFFKAFNERKYTQGKDTFEGKTKVFVAASNKYLNSIYEAYGNDAPQALIDRFLIVLYLPADFEQTKSILQLAHLDPLTPSSFFLEDLDLLSKKIEDVSLSYLNDLEIFYIYNSTQKKLKEQENTSLEAFLKAKKRGERVQPPYRSTRVFSPRTLRKSYRVVKAYTYLQHASSSKSQTIEPSFQDIEEALGFFYRLQGPNEAFLEKLLSQPHLDPYEKSQLEAIRIETTAYQESVSELHQKEQLVSQRLNTLLNHNFDFHSKNEENALYPEIIQYTQELMLKIVSIEEAQSLTAEQIAALKGLRTILNHPIVKQNIGR